MANSSEVTTYDGSQDFSGGIDSVKVPTIKSTENPNGLASNQLAWLSNATVRDGGITPRAGWNKILGMFPATSLFQRGYMYQPSNANPYQIFSISGKIYKVDVETLVITLLSTTPALSNPPTIERAFFCQGEQFLVIQPGDYTTLPLFWDGTILRRSDGDAHNLGLVDVAGFVAPALNHAVNIPVVTPPGWAGYDGQRFGINGDYTTGLYIKVNHLWNIGLRNIGNTVPPLTAVPAGTDLMHFNGTFAAKFLVPYTIPALNAVDNAWLDRQYVGAVNDFVTIKGNLMQVTSITTGDAPAGSILAVNLNMVAGTAVASQAGLISVPEIGVGGAMDYVQGRLWYEVGRIYLAGDIVGGPSGTAFYNKKDSILKTTENPLVLSGDGFTVPDNAGNIRALFHLGNINTTLGQSNLYIGTAKAIYQLDVPVTRTDWIAAGNSNQPQQTITQLSNGTVNDRSVTLVNGDAWYQTLEPSIASLNAQVRNFSQWGTISLSANENRILQFNNRALLHMASGIYFNSRLLQTSLPRQLPQGVVHDALIPLDFVPISSYGASLTPNWEGSLSGLQILEVYLGNFGGRERAFAAVVSNDAASPGQIQLWELTTGDRYDNGGNRIEWYAEFPSFTAGDLGQLKELVACEIGVDRLVGTVDFNLEYRPDFSSCYTPWARWQACSARNSTEDVNNPTTYPLVEYCAGYRQVMTIGVPPMKCQTQMDRPMSQGYSFQPKLTVKGFCRIRMIKLYFKEIARQLYSNPIC